MNDSMMEKRLVSIGTRIEERPRCYGVVLAGIVAIAFGISIDRSSAAFTDEEYGGFGLHSPSGQNVVTSSATEPLNDVATTPDPLVQEDTSDNSLASAKDFPQNPGSVEEEQTPTEPELPPDPVEPIPVDPLSPEEEPEPPFDPGTSPEPAVPPEPQTPSEPAAPPEPETPPTPETPPEPDPLPEIPDELMCLVTVDEDGALIITALTQTDTMSTPESLDAPDALDGQASTPAATWACLLRTTPDTGETELEITPDPQIPETNLLEAYLDAWRVEHGPYLVTGLEHPDRIRLVRCYFTDDETAETP
jgi:hypothetical protein